MNKYFQKYETLICMLLIIGYIVSNSLCLQNFGNTSYMTAFINLIFSLAIILFILKNNLTKYYGLTKVTNAKEFLYFIPLLLLVLVNILNGININNSFHEILAHILNMIGVGFLEEIIFRGFLYKMMEKYNIKRATIVSSITFGIGHIINLLNGATLVPTLIQICYATLAGYLFVVIFQKSKSLIPCILTHIGINALSIFNIENTVSLYMAPIILILIPIFYSRYIIKNIKE